MSSTNRGGRGPSEDFYGTPEWATHLLLREVQLSGGHWLEPGAGGGAIIRAVQSFYPDEAGPIFTAVEMEGKRRESLVETGAGVIIGDFLGFSPPLESYSVAIGNPPYSLAQEFIEHAMSMADQVVFLLRFGFLEAKKRRSFFEKYGAPDTFVLGSRPSFTGGGTDSTAYAWMRWKNPMDRKDGKGKRRQDGRLRILYRDDDAKTVPEVRAGEHVQSP